MSEGLSRLGRLPQGPLRIKLVLTGVAHVGTHTHAHVCAHTRVLTRTPKFSLREEPEGETGARLFAASLRGARSALQLWGGRAPPAH